MFPRIISSDSVPEQAGALMLEIAEIEISCDGSFGPYARYKGDTAHVRVLCAQSNIKIVFEEDSPTTLAELVVALATQVRRAIDVIAATVNVTVNVQNMQGQNEF